MHFMARFSESIIFRLFERGENIWLTQIGVVPPLGWEYCSEFHHSSKHAKVATVLLGKKGVRRSFSCNHQGWRCFGLLSDLNVNQQSWCELYSIVMSYVFTHVRVRPRDGLEGVCQVAPQTLCSDAGVGVRQNKSRAYWFLERSLSQPALLPFFSSNSPCRSYVTSHQNLSLCELSPFQQSHGRSHVLFLFFFVEIIKERLMAVQDFMGKAVQHLPLFCSFPVRRSLHV